MKYRIEERKAITIVGLKKWMNLAEGQNLRDIPKMWAELTQEPPKKIVWPDGE